MPAIFDPWSWIAAAAGLAILETLLPGYVLLGFGIGAAAIAVALFPLAGAVRALPYAPLTLLAAWAAVSIAAWFAVTLVWGRPSRRPAGGRDLNDFDSSF